MIYPITWVILVGVVGAVVALGIATSLLDMIHGPWKSLSDRFPGAHEHPTAMESPKGERWSGTITLMTRERWDRLSRGFGCLAFLLFPFYWPWRGINEYSVHALDDGDTLHLQMDGGRFAQGASVSIPWAAAEPIGASDSICGTQTAFAIEDLVLLLPESLARRELEVRARMSQSEAQVGSGDAEAGGTRPEGTDDRKLLP